MQGHAIRLEADGLGAELGGIVEDPAVSAFKVHPMKRKKIGAFLREPPPGLAYLIYFKQDRFVRRVYPDFTDMVTWAREHKVKLISATEDLGDPTEHATMVVPFLKAWLGEGESISTGDRLKGHYLVRRQKGLWNNGTPPYGYMSVLVAPKQHRLEIDPEAAEVVREAVRRVLAGESVNAIVADFNRRGIASPKNRQRQLMGRDLVMLDGRSTAGVAWTCNALMRILRSQALLGYVIHNYAALTDDSGEPIVRAPALISETDFDHLQLILDQRREENPRTRKLRQGQNPSLLLQIAFCAECRSPFYQWSTTKAIGAGQKRTYFKYKCRTNYWRANHRVTCGSEPIDAGWLNDLATALFLGEVGDEPIPRKTFRRTDNSEEIARVRRALKAARDEFDAGGYDYEGGESEYSERVARWSARLRQLGNASGKLEDVTEAAGKTFAQSWAELQDAGDVVGMRRLMQAAGFRLEIGFMHGRLSIAHFIDPELPKRAGLAASGQPVASPPDSYARWREDALAIMRAVATRSPGIDGATLLTIEKAD